MHLYLCNRRSQCCLDFHQFHCINSCQSVDVEKLKNGKMTPAYRRLKVAEKQFGFATNKRNVRTIFDHVFMCTTIYFKELFLYRVQRRYASIKLNRIVYYYVTTAKLLLINKESTKYWLDMSSSINV